MQKIGLIMLACVALLSCKSRKSQVQKSVYDSTSSNLETNNIDVKAGLYRVTNTSGTLDSTWTIGMRFNNFSGIIYNDGKIEGHADQAEITNRGSKKSGTDQTIHEGDTTKVNSFNEKKSNITLHATEDHRQNEVKGKQVPWYVWLIGIAGLVLLGYFVVSKVKTKLKIF
ncbi:hypothetical protein [Sphingobacterium thalpophilum]|uniref:hypothetical protein n=1 Tax=Sphingobacterium thalpophilum TaxID=259 RepID=UPI0024A6AC6D|nr:hypothetical protein [Sphingobacterium thalpophilum]